MIYITNQRGGVMLKIKKIVFLMISLVAFSVFTCPASATDIYVDSYAQSPGGPGDCTLGEAIQAANTDSAVDGCSAGSGADIIYLPAGTYLLTTADNTTQGDNALPDINSTIAVIGMGSDRGDTLITTGGAAGRVFHISPAAILSLENLTLNNGTATSGYIGGAIHNNQATLNVSNCQILHSRAVSGGGISNVVGTLTITDSFLSGNSAVTDTGGGIYNSGGTVNIVNSVISLNYASSDGGGIYTAANGIVNISSSTVKENTATDAGGGLYNNDGTIDITSSTFSGNLAGDGAGGGIYSGSFQAILNISNSTFSGNSAATAGGGIGNLGGTLTAAHITVYGNSSNTGGGIANGEGMITLKNSIIAGNTINSAVGPDCFGTITTAEYNLIGDDADCTISSGTGNLLNTNPQLGPLQGNGGPTFTHALLDGSPAIDSGTNIGVAATDQRGFPRISNGTTDIGAYEFQVDLAAVPTTTSVPTMNGWGLIILSLLMAGLSFWYIRSRDHGSC